VQIHHKPHIDFINELPFTAICFKMYHGVIVCNSIATRF